MTRRNKQKNKWLCQKGNKTKQPKGHLKHEFSKFTLNKIAVFLVHLDIVLMLS